MNLKGKLSSAIAKFIIKRLYRTQRRHWFVITFIMSMFIASSVYWTFSKQNPACTDYISINQLRQNSLAELVKIERGAGCEMPILDPFSAEAMQFNEEVHPIVCDGVDWVECYFSECYVTKPILNNMKDIVCTYTDIIFVTDNYYKMGDSTKVYGSEKYALTRSDHVKVSCTGTEKDGMYKISARWFGYCAGYRPVPQPAPSHEDSLNVLLLMFDSTARNGFIRRMPNSYKVLTEELKAVVMSSYNIVEDATYGALFPILTGHTELELPNYRRAFSSRYVDVERFIYHVLKKHGYRTAYYEDMPFWGTFQERFNGFEHQPTDHYTRPLFMKESKNGEKWLKGLKGKYCFGATPQHKFMLDYTAQLPGKKFCHTFIAGISHDDFNMISVADDDLVQFLRKFRDDKHLENTTLFVMGDHGPRYEAFRNTYQGKIEESLPFVSVVLPEKLKKTRPFGRASENLIANSEVLTTPFDVHTTLLDALGLKQYENNYRVPGADVNRGMSFLEPIPKSRSCAEAGIMPYWCACAKWRNVSQTDPLYKQAAMTLANYINKLSSEQSSKCAKRKLFSIEWVARQSLNDIMNGKYERVINEYYQAKIVMTPGRSIFEGSMQYIARDHLFLISERDISRINAYGNEPSCLSKTHPHLNKYCYCKEN